MYRRLSCLVLGLCFVSPMVRAHLTAAPLPRPHAMPQLSSLPLAFEPNRGQTAGADFIARGQRYAIALTSSSVAFDISDRVRSGRLLLTLVGGNAAAQAAAEDARPGIVNYLMGNDPSRWHTRVPTFGRVRYRSVYPGIDVAYYGNGRRLEYDFIVAPGADPSAIEMRLDGAGSVTLGADEALTVSGASGPWTMARPLIYQQIDGARKVVDGGYVIKDGRISFHVGAYDRRAPLVIDPDLTYSTFLGGSGNDRAVAAGLDASGAAYVAGMTTSASFPPAVANTQYWTSFPQLDPQHLFVAKLDQNGALVYLTFVGAPGDGDTLGGMAVSKTGVAYVTGTTGSSSFPTTSNALQTVAAGFSTDAFLFALTPDGTTLSYSTYIAGNNIDEGHGVALDSSSHVYVAGRTASSSGFPITSGAFQATPGGSVDAFVMEFDVTKQGAASLLHSTLLGGYADDSADRLAIDANGVVYLTGLAQSPNPAAPGVAPFPTTVSAYQPTSPGGYHAYLAALDPTLSSLIYSTYLRGSAADGDEQGGTESGSVAALDRQHVYVSGTTSSTTFPDTFGTGAHGNTDAFVLELDTTVGGNASLLWSRYLGGSGADVGTGLVVDQNENLYLTGDTSSINLPGLTPFPTTGCTYSSDRKGDQDAFLTRMDGNGSLLFSTYLGGNGLDHGNAVAVDGSGNAFVAGDTYSSSAPNTFPTTPNAFQVTQSGGAGSGDMDAFLTEIPTGDCTSHLVVHKRASAEPVEVGTNLTYTISVVNDGPSANTNVTLTDPLPKDVTFISVDPAPPCSVSGLPGNQTVTCDIGTLAASAEFDATIVTQVTGDNSVEGYGVLVNTACAKGDLGNPKPLDGCGTVWTTASPGTADLAVSVTATPNPVYAGNIVDYVITAMNNGPDTSQNVSVTAALSGTSTAGAFVAAPFCNGTPLKCALGAIASGASASVTIHVTPVVAGSIHMAVNTSLATVDPDLSNNSPTADVTVLPAADLTITQTVTKSPAVAGMAETFAVFVKNTGPSPATGVSIVDTMPAATTLVSAPGCTPGAQLTCAIGTIASGATAEIDITVGVDPSDVDPIVNTATASANEFDKALPNTSTVSVPVVAQADLAIAMTGSPTSVPSGAVLTYTITVTNNGPSAASNASVVLPLSGQLAGPLPAGCVLFVGKIHCPIASLPLGGLTTFTIQTIPTGLGPTLTSTATVSCAEDGIAGNNSATVTTSVTPPVSHISVKLQESPNPIGPNGLLIYVAQVLNTGPSVAFGVVLTDPLPAGTAVQFLPGNCAFSSQTSQISCALGDIAVNGSATVKFELSLTIAGKLTKLPIVNTVKASAPGGTASASVTTQKQ